VIIALNYDAATGGVTLWDSLNGTVVRGTVAKGNFAAPTKRSGLGALSFPPLPQGSWVK